MNIILQRLFESIQPDTSVCEKSIQLPREILEELARIIVTLSKFSPPKNFYIERD